MLVCRQSNLKTYLKRNFRSLLAISLLSLFTVGCEENKAAQCEQIFQIAQDVSENNQNASYIGDQQSFEMKSWLQAANNFSQAADNITALKINHRELINYQNQLATVYRIYSQATYDAVTARENKNLSALKSARNDATKAGEIQHELIKKINTYCLDN